MSATDDHANSRSDAVAQELRSLVGRLRRRLREQSDVGDLTPSQTAVLLRIEKDGPATTSMLARAEGMRPQSMGAVIAALESGGLVVGRPDPDDGRQTILSLSDACRERIAEGRAARQDWLSRRIEERLSPAEHRQLGDAFGLLSRLIDD